MCVLCCRFFCPPGGQGEPQRPLLGVFEGAATLRPVARRETLRHRPHRQERTDTPRPRCLLRRRASGTFTSGFYLHFRFNSTSGFISTSGLLLERE